MQEKFIDYIVEADVNLLRCDLLLSNKFNIKRKYINSAIESGMLFLDNSVIKKSSLKIKEGQKIHGKILVDYDVKEEAIVSEAMLLDIYYQDDDILVVCKPKGIVTHPGNGNLHGTLLQGILHQFPSCFNLPKYGLIQRLDKDTSGLMVVALSNKAYDILVDMMQRRLIKRQYHALVWGRPPEEKVIDAPIARNPTDRTLRKISDSGREAITLMRALAYGKYGALVECTLKTGRTHQIRLHMKYINYPVCGDLSYGIKHPPFPSPPGWKGQALHARLLSFNHPILNKNMEFIAPYPFLWQEWLNVLNIV